MTNTKRFMWNVLHTFNLLFFAALATGQQLAPITAPSTSCTPSAPVVALVVGFVLLVAVAVWYVIAHRRPGAQFGEAWMDDMARRVARKVLETKMDPAVTAIEAPAPITFDGRTFATTADLEHYKALKAQLDAIPKP